MVSNKKIFNPHLPTYIYKKHHLHTRASELFIIFALRILKYGSLKRYKSAQRTVKNDSTFGMNYLLSLRSLNILPIFSSLTISQEIPICLRKFRMHQYAYAPMSHCKIFAHRPTYADLETCGATCKPYFVATAILASKYAHTS